MGFRDGGRGRPSGAEGRRPAGWVELASWSWVPGFAKAERGFDGFGDDVDEGGGVGMLCMLAALAYNARRLSPGGRNLSGVW